MDARQQRITYLANLIDRVNVTMRPRMREEWPDVEMTMPQLRTLILLSNGPIRMGDIAEQIGSSVSATTAMIDRLVEKNLVVRAHDTTDRRVVVCELSETGQQVLKDFWRLGRRQVEELGAALSNEQLTTVIEAMEILSTTVERLANEAEPAATSV